MFTVDDLNLKSTLIPRADNLLVLPLVQATAGTIVHVGQNREHPEKGVVLEVGPGGIGPETGRPVAVLSRRGELVAFGRYAGLRFEIEGPAAEDGRRQPVDVLIMRDAEVLLAQEPGTFDLVMHDGDPRKMHEPGLICEHCPKVEGEAGVERLRLIAAGSDPDAQEPMPETQSDVIAQERERLRQARAAEDAALTPTT